MISNKYREMKERHEKETNAFPMKFAFSKEQFAEGMRELGLEPTDTDKVYKIPGGGFIRRSDSKAFTDLFLRHGEEFEAAIKADKKGTGFIYQMFLYELNNHEYGYTGEIDDTLDALGLTAEKVENTPNLKSGLERAIRKIDGFQSFQYGG